MEFSLKEKDDAMMGEDFDVEIKVKNNGKVQRKIDVTLTASVVNYTGVLQKLIKSLTTSVYIKPDDGINNCN